MEDSKKRETQPDDPIDDPTTTPPEDSCPLPMNADEGFEGIILPNPSLPFLAVGESRKNFGSAIRIVG